MTKLSTELQTKISNLFTENFYEPYDKPYKVGDEFDVVITGDNVFSTKVKVLETSIIEQYRQYKLEFSDKSTGWFTLNFIKNKLN